MPTENNTYHPRLKDMSKRSFNFYEGLSSQMKSFVDDYYSSEFYKKNGSKLELTSGRRSSDQKIGKYSKTSKHNTGDAIDFSAMNSDIFNFYKNDDEGIALVKKHNASLLDETTAEAMAKTGATGKHYHIQLNGDIVAHEGSDGHNHDNEGVGVSSNELSNDILENPYNFNQDIEQLYAEALEKDKEMSKRTEEQKELESEQEVVNKEIEDANSFLKMFSNLGSNDDPMQEIKSSNNNDVEVPLYAFQDLQLQRYNPNMFTVGNKNI